MFGGLKTIGIRLLIINNNNNHGNCVHEHYHLIFGIKTMIMLSIQLVGVWLPGKGRHEVADN